MCVLTTKTIGTHAPTLFDWPQIIALKIPNGNEFVERHSDELKTIHSEQWMRPTDGMFSSHLRSYTIPRNSDEKKPQLRFRIQFALQTYKLTLI